MNIELIKVFDYSRDLDTDDKYINTEFVDDFLYVSKIDREEHVSGNEVNQIIKYNIKDKNSKGKVIHTFPTKFNDLKFIDQTLIVSNNKYIFVLLVDTSYNNTKEKVIQIDIKTNKIIKILNTLEKIETIYVDDKKLYTVSTDGGIKIYSVDDKPKFSKFKYIPFNETEKSYLVIQRRKPTNSIKMISNKKNIYLGYNVNFEKYDSEYKKNFQKFHLYKIDKNSKTGDDLPKKLKGNIKILKEIDNFIYTQYTEPITLDNGKKDTKSSLAKIDMNDFEIVENYYNDYDSKWDVSSLLIEFGLLFVGGVKGIINIFDEKTGELLENLHHTDIVSENFPWLTIYVGTIQKMYIKGKYLYAVSAKVLKRWDLTKIPVVQKRLNKIYSDKRMSLKIIGKNNPLLRLPNDIENVIVKQSVLKNNNTKSKTPRNNTKSKTPRNNTKSKIPKNILDELFKELKFENEKECTKRPSKNNKKSLKKDEIIEILTKYTKDYEGIRKRIPKGFRYLRKNEICEAIFQLKK